MHNKHTVLDLPYREASYQKHFTVQQITIVGLTKYWK